MCLYVFVQQMDDLRKARAIITAMNNTIETLQNKCKYMSCDLKIIYPSLHRIDVYIVAGGFNCYSFSCVKYEIRVSDINSGKLYEYYTPWNPSIRVEVKIEHSDFRITLLIKEKKYFIADMDNEGDSDRYEICENMFRDLANILIQFKFS